jgi:hypothetical protein
MKLYATTEGQKLEDGKFKKVSKAQGSNHQLNVFISVDESNQNKFDARFKIFVNVREDGTTDFTLTDGTLPYPKNTVFTTSIPCNGKHDDVNAIIKCADCSKTLDNW